MFGDFKKIAIFGATGMTGQCALEAALKHDLSVQVLVRDKSRLPEKFLVPSVLVIEGDVLSLPEVIKTVEGTDGVVVVLGTRNDLSPTTVMSDGLKNILEAMHICKVRYISVCLSAFLFYEEGKVPKIFHSLNEDHKRMFECLKNDAQTKWIAVFPPHIAETLKKDQEESSDEAVVEGTCKVQHDKSPGRSVSKYHLGAFLVECLAQPEHYNKVCGICTVLPEAAKQ